MSTEQFGQQVDGQENTEESPPDVIGQPVGNENGQPNLSSTPEVITPESLGGGNSSPSATTTAAVHGAYYAASKNLGSDRNVQAAITKGTRNVVNKYGNKVLSPFIKDPALQRKIMNNTTRAVSGKLANAAGALDVMTALKDPKQAAKNYAARKIREKVFKEIAKKLGLDPLKLLLRQGFKQAMIWIFGPPFFVGEWVIGGLLAIMIIFGLLSIVGGFFSAFTFTHLTHDTFPKEHVYPYTEIQVISNIFKERMDEQKNIADGNMNTNSINSNASEPETPGEMLTNNMGTLENLYGYLKVIDLDTLADPNNPHAYNPVNPGEQTPLTASNSNLNINGNTNSSGTAKGIATNPYNDSYVAYRASQLEQKIDDFKALTNPLEKDLAAIELVDSLRNQLVFEMFPCWRVANQAVGYYWIDERFFHIALTKNDKLYLSKGKKAFENAPPGRGLKPILDPDPGMCRYLYHTISANVAISKHFSEVIADLEASIDKWTFLGKPIQSVLKYITEKQAAGMVALTTPIYEFRMAFLYPKGDIKEEGGSFKKFIDPIAGTEEQLLKEPTNADYELDECDPSAPYDPMNPCPVSPRDKHKIGRAFDIYTVYGHDIRCAVGGAISPLASVVCDVIDLSINQRANATIDAEREKITGAMSNINENDNSNTSAAGTNGNDNTNLVPGYDENGNEELRYKTLLGDLVGPDQKFNLAFIAEIMKVTTVFSMYWNQLQDTLANTGSAVSAMFSFKELRASFEDWNSFNKATQDSIPYSILGSQFSILDVPRVKIGWWAAGPYITPPYFFYKGKVVNGVTNLNKYLQAANLSALMKDRIHVEFKPVDRSLLKRQFQDPDSTVSWDPEDEGNDDAGQTDIDNSGDDEDTTPDPSVASITPGASDGQYCGVRTFSQDKIEWLGTISEPKLSPPAAAALERLAAAWSGQNNSEKLPIVSAFRSNATQQSMWDACHNPDGSKRACSYDNPAKPGNSAHESGLAIDINLESLGNSAEEVDANWKQLKQLARTFGWRCIGAGSNYPSSEDHHFNFDPGFATLGSKANAISKANQSSCGSR